MTETGRFEDGTYTAETGKEVTLIRYQEKDARKGWPKEYWTYTDERGYGPSIGYLSNRHLTKEAAIERLEDEEKIRVATEDLPEALDRDGYEAACQVAGIEALDDDKILRAAYAIKHGEFEMPEYTADKILSYAIAKPRLEALGLKKKATAKAAPASDIIAPAGTTSTRRSYGTGRCVECGKTGSYWNPGAGSFLCGAHWDEY